jgi:membrane-bound lytic murein transglycosylase A
MIAQDTGSAIVGPARADLYWGAGSAAGRVAGRIRHAGRFVMLLPRELDMVEAGRQMPLPVAKPKIPDDEKNSGPERGDVKKAAGKSKAQSGKTGNELKAAKKPSQQAGPARAPRS